MAHPNPPSSRPVAFITGASSGFGRGLALRLAEAGYAVGVSARREDRLKGLVEEVEASGGKAVSYPCDVADRDALLEAIRRSESELGPVDLLIANAGVSTHAPPEELDTREVERVMAINFLGTVAAAEAVLPGMLGRRAGHIVVVSSLASFQGLLHHGSYCASKAAMNAFFESLRLDVRHQGIDVTIIAPGFVKTEMTANSQNPMPFLMELEPALDIMLKGIRKRKKLVRFPAPLSTATFWARILPRGAYDWFVGKVMGRGKAGATDA